MLAEFINDLRYALHAPLHADGCRCARPAPAHAGARRRLACDPIRVAAILSVPWICLNGIESHGI